MIKFYPEPIPTPPFSFATVTAGTDFEFVIGSGDTSLDGLVSSYFEIVNARILQDGLYKVSFGLASSNGSTYAFGHIGKNGAAIGTERSTSFTTFVVYDEDITFAAGDTVQIFAYNSSQYASSAYYAKINDAKLGVLDGATLLLTPRVLAEGAR